ncbi:MAG: MarR family transcriptional regulator [Candidatus Aureabacteria bacterium]|nr:MarR family transcriptional regulator [Candidatus Auribacterota bacterium]
MKRQQEILKLLRQVHMRFAKFYSKKIASRRVTPPQYMMLMILLEEGAQKMHDLADFLQVSTPAVTNLVDKLEASGYATRSPHPTDRRAHVIALTPAGTRFITALRDDGLALLKDTIGTMSASDQEVVRRFYQNLRARLDAALERPGKSTQ